VSQAADAHHADHARGALHRVRLAKDRVDGGLIVRRGLQRQEPGCDAFEVALGLLYEQWTELVL
jgi:hypothetical protein